MADEILVLTGDKDMTYDVVFLFPIPSPYQDINSNNFVVTPTSTFPVAFLDYLTPGEQTALNNGTAIFLIKRVTVMPDETPSAVVERVRGMYAEWSAKITERYDLTFKYVGTRVDAIP